VSHLPPLSAPPPQNNLEFYPVLAKPEALTAWSTLAGQLLAKALPQPGETGEPAGMPVSLDARPRWPWWRAKKWGAKVFVRLGDSYSQPKVRFDIRRGRDRKCR